MQHRFVSYLGVSTDRQGRSGLGLEAQNAPVAAHLRGGGWTLLDEIVEVESGKGTADRPQLARAMALCRLTGVTLCVAKLDRLSRDAHLLIGPDKADVDFVAVDMPNANRLMVGIVALVAAKAQGRKLGGYRGSRHQLPTRPAPPAPPRPACLPPASGRLFASCKGQA